MAISYLGFGEVTEKDTDVNPLSGSVTVNASADFVLVAIAWGDDVSAGTISSVTLGGESLTALTASTGSMGGFPGGLQFFYKTSPLTGSRTLSATFSVTPFTSHATIMYFSGVDSTTPVEGLNGGSGTGTAINQAPTTTTVSGDYLVGSNLSNTELANVSTSDTQVTETDLSAFINVIQNVAYEALTGSGGQINWTNTSSVDYRNQVVVVKASTSTSHATSGALTGQGSTVDGAATNFTPHATTGALTGQGSDVTGTAAVIRTHTTSGALTGQGSTVDGTATNFTAHATSGTLEGQGSTVTGTATNFTPHATTGVLEGQGSDVTGSATRLSAHVTSGALVGQGSDVTGAATNFTVHVTSGTLEGPGSDVTGTATNFTIHATSGTLEGPGSDVTGTSVHNKPHPTSGVLEGQGSTVTGSATHFADTEHSTSGVLIGQGSTLAGTATNFTIHATSGVLEGAGASITGTSVHNVTHASSGVLEGQGSDISGTAQNGEADDKSGVNRLEVARLTELLTQRKKVSVKRRKTESFELVQNDDGSVTVILDRPKPVKERKEVAEETQVSPVKFLRVVPPLPEPSVMTPEVMQMLKQVEYDLMQEQSKQLRKQQIEDELRQDDEDVIRLAMEYFFDG